MKEPMTPGYEWFEIPHDQIFMGSFNRQTQDAIDLRKSHPLPESETLQSVWDDKQSQTIETHSGTKIHTMTFNPRAMGGTIFWLPGWGVTNRWNGGARVVTTIAAMNPDKVVRTADELRHVPRDQKLQVLQGDMGPYTSNYMYAIDDRLDDLQVLSGHSRGGVIQTILASHADMPQLDTINLIDMPRARNYATATGFVVRVGLLDNLRSGEQRNRAATSEEDVLLGAIPERKAEGMPEWMAAYDKAEQQWWLLQGLAREGLRAASDRMMDAQPGAEVFWWHGTRSLGTPVRSMRKLVHEVLEDLPPERRNDLHYFEAPTGHYAQGHTARYGRQTTYAITHTPSVRD
jgi:hypothetical protein